MKWTIHDNTPVFFIASLLIAFKHQKNGRNSELGSHIVSMNDGKKQKTSPQPKHHENIAISSAICWLRSWPKIMRSFRKILQRTSVTYPYGPYLWGFLGGKFPSHPNLASEPRFCQNMSMAIYCGLKGFNFVKLERKTTSKKGKPLPHLYHSLKLKAKATKNRPWIFPSQKETRVFQTPLLFQGAMLVFREST